jgi:hypothetical protein
MSGLLDQLGRDTLPRPVIDEFVHWCIWQQARQALVLVLEDNQLMEIAAEIQSAVDLLTAERLSKEAKDHIQGLSTRNDPMGLSAAEGAAFEFINMAAAAKDDVFDVEGVSFLSSRVCGWAGWALNGYANPQEKVAAEQAALQAQEAHLQELWDKYDDNGN